MDRDKFFMTMALEEAKIAGDAGEVPVGAVLVLGDEVITRAGNRKERACDPTAHAEVLVLREASLKLASWRLSPATIYVTMEPCIMCMGALLLARVRRLVYGCADPKAGACGSLYDLSKDVRLNHSIDVTAGVLEEKCRELIQSFFKSLRNNGKR